MRKIKLYPIFVCFWLALALVVMIAPSAFADWQATATPTQPTLYKTATMPAPSGVSGTLTASSVVTFSGAQFLNGISCPSTTECWAVGVGSSGGGVAVEWINGTWDTPQTIPNTSTSTMLGISCPSTTYCMAVGLVAGPTSICPGYGGCGIYTTWTQQAGWNSPSTVTDVYNLSSVSCPSTTECWAVGYWENTAVSTNGYGVAVNINQGSVDVINGTVGLNDISCPSTTECWATGNATNGGGTYYDIVSEWINGAWTAPETLVNDTDESLYVSCPVTTYCMAVVAGAVFEWTQGSWTQSPSVPITSLSISCPSSSVCWVAGDFGSSGEVAEWTASGGWGTAQSISGTTELRGISCPSTSLCWAVGEDSSNVGVAYDPIPSLSLTWTPPTNTSDADGNPLVGSQQIVEAPYNGSTCGTSWSPVTSGLSASATSATVSSPSSSECYSVEAVGRSGSWTSSVGSGEAVVG